MKLATKISRNGFRHTRHTTLKNWFRFLPRNSSELSIEARFGAKMTSLKPELISNVVIFVK